MKRFLVAIAVAAMTIAFPGSAGAQQPALSSNSSSTSSLSAQSSAKWTKTYVVEWNEPAMYYGAKTGVIDPGTDCPQGTNPSPDWIQVLVAAGYTEEEAKWLRNPANPTRSPVHGQNQMAFRGKDRANVYVNPTSTPDPGLVGVSGTIAEGLNLDDDKKTGFTSPTGEKGMDNNFYKALGCWKTYRGPHRLSSGALNFNDAMRDGMWTTVIVVAGEGADPMNDDHVTVGFYMSNDKMVKDGLGNVARDYTFRIAPHAKHEGILPARTVNGRIISRAPADIVFARPFVHPGPGTAARTGESGDEAGRLYHGVCRRLSAVGTGLQGLGERPGHGDRGAHMGTVACGLLRLAPQRRLQPNGARRREDPHLLRAPNRRAARVCDDAG